MDTILLSGYSGYGTVDGTQVLVTNGNFSASRNIPTFKFAHNPTDSTSISDVQVGDGTVSFSGSVSFDLDETSLALVSTDFLQRNKKFDVCFYDGHRTRNMIDCYWNSFSINISSQSVVTASINFVSANGKSGSLTGTGTGSGTATGIFIKSRNLIKYWNSGNTGVESATINFSQEVTPVYLNPTVTGGSSAGGDTMDLSALGSECFPDYFRCGALNVDISVESYDDWVSYKTIYVGSKAVTLTNAAVTELSFTHNGISDVGTHSYSCRGINVSSPIDVLFTIS